MDRNKRRCRKPNLLRNLTDVIAILNDQDFDLEEILGAVLVLLMKEKKLSMKKLVNQIDKLRLTEQKIQYILDQEANPYKA